MIPNNMTSSLVTSLPVLRITRSRLFRSLPVLTFLCGLSGALMAQAPADPNAGGGRGRRGQNGANGQNGAPGNGGNGGGRGNFDPAQAQQQMMDRMREQFGVTDDAEWKLISDRLTAVTELRRAAVTGGFGGFGGRGGPGGPGGGQGGPGGPGGQGGGRQGRTASPEQDALRQAITDNLPDAEIKSRLARVREVRKANEEKLTKAQEELRAVLTMRQEAVAVMAGLLP